MTPEPDTTPEPNGSTTLPCSCFTDGECKAHGPRKPAPAPPSREWIENAAKEEDGCQVTAGGLAADLGLTVAPAPPEDEGARHISDEKLADWYARWPETLPTSVPHAQVRMLIENLRATRADFAALKTDWQARCALLAQKDAEIAEGKAASQMWADRYAMLSVRRDEIASELGRDNQEHALERARHKSTRAELAQERERHTKFVKAATQENDRLREVRRDLKAEVSRLRAVCAEVERDLRDMEYGYDLADESGRGMPHRDAAGVLAARLREAGKEGET